jgi:Periplasmic copper-binding protein (NosD)
MKLIACFIMAFLICLTSFAQTFYVAPSGSDSNDGLSMSSPFLTIQHASNTVMAGDSVIVLPGTYAGFYHTTSGTAAQKIVFHALQGVIINMPNGTTNDGINLEGASHVIIEGFSISGVPRAGIRSVENEQVIIRNNAADLCGVWGILTGFSEDILIENNECSRSIDEHGIYFSNSADNPVIRGNICWGNNACGIQLNADINLGGDGITTNALIENNILYDNGVAGGSAINCDGVQNSVIQNNLIYNNHASGISLYQGDGGGGSSGNIIVHNTIIQPSDSRWALNINTGSVHNIVFNNIFYSTHSFRGSISIDQSSIIGFKSNHNSLTDRMSDDGGNSNMTLAEWQQATQLDSNSVIAMPMDLFVNPSADDYHLLSSSPAINLGRSAYHSAMAPLSDLDNNLRPQGAYPDAGAYEFNTVSSAGELLNPDMNWTDILETEKITAIDLSGKLVFSGYKKQLDTSSLVSGLYIIYTMDTSKVVKMVVVR